MNSHLEQYRNYILKLAETESAETFLNSSSAHAACVMSNIFKVSNTEVLILAGDLSGEISMKDDYNFELIKFLRRGGKVKYLLTNYSKDKYIPLFFILNDKEFEDKIEVKSINNSEIQIHFAIGDLKMYRLEHDTTNFIAAGSFNNPNTAKVLNSIFQKYYKSATLVDIKAHLS